MFPLKKPESSIKVIINMPGKPHKSILIPYEMEILALRHRRPPMPYAEIAELLRQKYNVNVQAPAIFKFMKVRSGGRKVFSYGRNVGLEKPASIAPISKRKDPEPTGQPRPFFNYTPSDRYNLHGLPPEESAVRRKKLEVEGH
jgi:hypothetical protein